MLACACDRKAASLMGINVDTMVTLSFASPRWWGPGRRHPGADHAHLLRRGDPFGSEGLRSLYSGGTRESLRRRGRRVILGVLESLSAGLISSGYKDAVAFVILLTLLFVRPSGLFGRRAAERV